MDEKEAEARPVMGTIFLVLLGERSEPHTGVFNRDFAWYVGRYVCMSVVCQITWNHVNQTRACSKSVLGAKSYQ